MTSATNDRAGVTAQYGERVAELPVIADPDCYSPEPRLRIALAKRGRPQDLEVLASDRYKSVRDIAQAMAR